MSHYKPYPAYKDSGVEWLGRVPEHWGIRTVKTLARLDGGAGFPDDEQGQSDNPIPFFKVAELANGLRYTANTVTEETATRLGAKIFPSSTLVFAKVGAALLLNRRCLLEMPACLDNNMMALLPGTYESQWMFWAFSTLDMGLIANPGAVPSINQEQVGNIRLAVPTIAEQKTIARSLKRETARIDALIEKKTRFIELLREKRQALITHAVTKGLDPNVKMKDSGVEWLGAVPEHWKLTPLKRLVSSIGQGWSPECESRPPDENEWGVVKVGCVNGGIFRPDESKALPAEMEPRPELGLKKGDVLVSRANTRELVGSCAVVPDDYPQLLLCDKLYRIGCGADVTPEFLAALIAVYGRRAVEIEATGASSSMVNIAQSVILDLVVAAPGKQEQDEIIDRISTATARIDSLGSKTERSIELLKERRSALITAAVTGQIDLRETA
ncbi:restriction endonuclease subunit S [Pseudomonas knackmussii]|uniref:restriction endonuclease subunit S n=1 Tax=Pseudomonas knackmussii TaxID=65741 RepID=UPI003BD38D3C